MVEKNEAEAYRLYEQLAEIYQDPEALYIVAMHSKDISTRRETYADFSIIAQDWLELSATKGYSKAMVEMGKICKMKYKTSHGSPEEGYAILEKAIQWFSKAATVNEAEGSFELGWCEIEKRIKKNKVADMEKMKMLCDEIMALFQNALKYGCKKAYYGIGLLYNSNWVLDEADREQHARQSFDCFMKAAESGEVDPYSHPYLHLGSFYQNGSSFVHQDIHRAKKFFSMGASLGDSACMLELDDYID
ncbi:MAG: hypothetical protein FWH55_11420 [Oscillospiraceae bacterium]|nr:hypothetical protein [Oscillospiraceae bacterium]